MLNKRGIALWCSAGALAAWAAALPAASQDHMWVGKEDVVRRTCPSEE